MKRQSDAKSREKVIRVANKYLNVLSYEGCIATDDYITAFIPQPQSNPEADQEMLIPVDEFKDYALNKGFLDFCNDFHDASQRDGHGQETGTMSWEQYENLPKHLIHLDITKFLKHKYSV